MDQRGFTFIELFLAVGSIGLVLPVLAVSVIQMVFETNRNNDRITALRPLENAVRELGKDIPLAQASRPVDGDFVGASSLTLDWTDWTDADQYDKYGGGEAVYKRSEAKYSLSGSDLQRQQRVCNDWDLDPTSPTYDTCIGTWTTSTTSTVARNVTSVQFSRSGNLFAIEVTSALEGSADVTEKRTFRVYGALLASQVPV